MKTYTFVGICAAARASQIRLRTLFESGDVILVNGLELERRPDPTGGRLDTFVILSGTYARDGRTKVPPERFDPNICAVCGVSVGLRRRIRLNARSACIPCHNLAFEQHNKAARAALGVS